MNLTIDFTGMVMLHLPKNVAMPGKFHGTAYMLGGDHKPRLTVPIRNLATKNMAQFPKSRSRAVYPPGGPIQAEIDITGLKVVFNDGKGTGDPIGAVIVPTHTNPPTKPDPKTPADWKDLGYALDLSYLGGTSKLHAAADGRSAARVILDRGSLFPMQPLDEPMSTALWEMKTPAGSPDRKHRVACVLRLEVTHTGGNDFLVRLLDPKDNDKEIGSLLLQPVANGIVPLSLSSLCEVKGAAETELKDVPSYQVFLEGEPTIHPPKKEGDGRSGDATQCPPAVLP